jgi:phage-related baseplate assembly protein
MTDRREFPSISFVDDDTQKLVNELISGYEHFTKTRLYPADPRRLFILWIADIMIQARINIDEAAKRNVLRFADGADLDSLAELFRDVERLPAKSAEATLRFYISAPQINVQIIPAGTRVTVNGEIIFETTEAASIEAGGLFGDAAAVCLMAGVVGNNFIPGQISQIVDLYPFFERVENITTSEGGSDEESDGAFYERMRESTEAYSTAGPLGAYIYHAKTASARIVDVKPSTPSPGVVEVRILLDNGEMPGEEMLKLVHEKLSDEKTRPLTDFVKVSAPQAKPFGIELTYFIPKASENSTAVIRRNVENAVAEYRKWQTERMGRDINPDKLIALIRNAGAKRSEIRSPVYSVTAENAVAVLSGEPVVIFGGLEDE